MSACSSFEELCLIYYSNCRLHPIQKACANNQLLFCPIFSAFGNSSHCWEIFAPLVVVDIMEWVTDFPHVSWSCNIVINLDIFIFSFLQKCIPLHSFLVLNIVFCFVPIFSIRFLVLRFVGFIVQFYCNSLYYVYILGFNHCMASLISSISCQPCYHCMIMFLIPLSSICREHMYP